MHRAGCGRQLGLPQRGQRTAPSHAHRAAGVMFSSQVWHTGLRVRVELPPGRQGCCVLAPDHLLVPRTCHPSPAPAHRWDLMRRHLHARSVSAPDTAYSCGTWSKCCHICKNTLCYMCIQETHPWQRRGSHARNNSGDGGSVWRDGTARGPRPVSANLVFPDRA